MPIEVATEPAVVTFARNAPRKIPGQTWYPILRKAANAIPVGAQTGVALACTKASFSPSLAATKYTAATAARMATRLGNRASMEPDLSGMLRRFCDIPPQVPGASHVLDNIARRVVHM